MPSSVQSLTFSTTTMSFSKVKWGREFWLNGKLTTYAKDIGDCLVVGFADRSAQARETDREPYVSRGSKAGWIVGLTH